MIDGICIPDKIRYLIDYSRDNFYISHHYFLRKKALLAIVEKKALEVVLYNASTGSIIKKIKILSYPQKIALSPDGETLVIVRNKQFSSENPIKDSVLLDTIEISTKKRTTRIAPIAFDNLSQLHFTSDSKSLIMSYQDKIQIYSIDNLKVQYEIDFQTLALKKQLGTSEKFALSTDRKMLALAQFPLNDTKKIQVSIIDLSTQKEIHKVTFTKKKYTSQFKISFSQNNNQLVYFENRTGRVQIYNFIKKTIHSMYISIKSKSPYHLKNFYSPILLKNILLFGGGVNPSFMYIHSIKNKNLWSQVSNSKNISIHSLYAVQDKLFLSVYKSRIIGRSCY